MKFSNLKLTTMKNYLKIILIFSLYLISFSANAQIEDLFETEEGETQGYSKESDQPLKRNFDLRQVQNAFNDSSPEKNIQNYLYDPKKIYKVKLRLHMNTMIYLPKGEEILAFSLGDNYAFEVQVFKEKIPNLLNVRSVYSGVDTSLSVITKSGNNYAFYLRSYPVKAKELPDFVVYIKGANSNPFQFIGQNKEGKQSSKFSPEEKSFAKSYEKRLALLKDLQKDNDYLKSIEDPYAINIDYEMYGDKEIAPFGVYDDGKWTYFDFRKDFISGRLPVVYKLIDEYDAVVNTRVENGFLIAESLSIEGWTLKNGDKSVCVKPTVDLQKKYSRKKKNKSFFRSLKSFFVGTKKDENS